MTPPPGSWGGPGRARDVVDRFAKDPDRPALLYRDAQDVEHQFSFLEMSEQIRRFANALETLGVESGEPLLVLLPPLPEWQVTVIGAMAAGVLAVPTSIGVLSPHEVHHRAAHSGAVAVVTMGDYTDLIDELAPQLPSLRHRILVSEDSAGARSRPAGWLAFDTLLAEADPKTAGRPTRLEDPALVFYTSGTTGPPKAVLHNHAYCYAAARQAVYWHGLRGTDRFWPTTGWAKAAFVPWSCGAEIVVTRERPDPKRTLADLESLAPDIFCAPPTQYRMMVKEDLTRWSAPRLRECVAAGEPLNPEVIESWHAATGIRIRDGYGQSEAGLLVANLVGLPMKPGSMGLPLPGFDIEAIDENGATQAVGQEGDLAVRLPAPGLFSEYWRDPEATERVRRGRWYRTGDRARRDADGYFWFMGRADDVILSGSHRIGPFDVESRLLEHPDVVEAAAVAAPDADLGQVVHAFVVLRGHRSTGETLIEELRALFPENEAIRRPSRFEFVDALPKTATGKIRRVELRREVQNATNRTPT